MTDTIGGWFSGREESVIPRPDIIPSRIPDGVLELTASLVVILLAWVAARILVQLTSRRIARHLERPSLTRVTLGGIKVSVYVFALLTILRINGLDLGSIALSVTVFSAVVGVILAPIVGSVISGIFLLADQPYEIGDMIELTDEGTRGFVDDITLRYTKVYTINNTFLIVPNGKMRDRDVINYSADDTRVRMSIEVMITYESDLSRARDVLEKSARTVDGVLTGGPKIRVGEARYTAAPECLVGEFGDDGILLNLRYWVQEPYRMNSIASNVRANIREAFRDEPCEFAYPHSHLVFDETSGNLQVDVGEQAEAPEHYRADGEFSQQ